MRTHKRERTIKPPKFDLEDVEDYYTFYVLIMGVPEDIFWYADTSFVEGVVNNKAAYDNWLDYAQWRESRKKKKG